MERTELERYADLGPRPAWNHPPEAFVKCQEMDHPHTRIELAPGDFVTLCERCRWRFAEAAPDLPEAPPAAPLHERDAPAAGPVAPER